MKEIDCVTRCAVPLKFRLNFTHRRDTLLRDHREERQPDQRGNPQRKFHRRRNVAKTKQRRHRQIGEFHQDDRKPFGATRGAGVCSNGKETRYGSIDMNSLFDELVGGGYSSAVAEDGVGNDYLVTVWHGAVRMMITDIALIDLRYLISRSRTLQLCLSRF